jgi:tripartite-type tricarboxylate transporter receptor subunit TctC
MKLEERMSRFAGLIGIVAVASVALWPPSSPAQEPYPSRTVKIVVPAIAGSTTDALARIVADQLSQKWGKATIVENIPGGAMNIGALSVARAAPDGYTLLIAPPSPLSFNHLLYRDTAYEPSKFVPITMLAKIPNVLVARKDLAAGTLQELIDYGKANPGKLTYASQGVGSTAHLSAAQLEVQTGIRMVHVPYRGAQPAYADIMLAKYRYSSTIWRAPWVRFRAARCVRSPSVAPNDRRCCRTCPPSQSPPCRNIKIMSGSDSGRQKRRRNRLSSSFITKWKKPSPSRL